jgi:methanogenic corrinoid protein MtbC1
MMEEILKQMQQGIIEGNAKLVEEQVQAALAAKWNPARFSTTG